MHHIEDSLDSALQLREEWNLPEDKLLDLKRLQRRMSIGSLASMKQVAAKRPCFALKKHEAQHTC